jgi:hypothetical protein
MKRTITVYSKKKENEKTGIEIQVGGRSAKNE